MIVSRLDHLNLSVHDLEASIDWYRDLFAFEVVERGRLEDGSPWAIIRGGDALLCLYPSPERRLLDGDALAEEKVHGINHFGLTLTDREAFETRAQEMGVTIRYGGAFRWPHATAFYVTDPTGWEIEVALWDDGEPQFT